MNPSAKTSTLIMIALVLAILAGFLIALSNIAKQQRILSIGSFEECALAGYPIMESYPEQCRTPDGRTFVNEKQAPSASGNSSMSPNGCVVAGCSSQLCISAAEAAQGGGVSTCEYRAEYGCYREAHCGIQANGTCGWSQTPELAQCLANPPQENPK